MEKKLKSRVLFRQLRRTTFLQAALSLGLFTGAQAYTYEMTGNRFVSPEEGKAALFANLQQGQTQRITGKVTDEKGEALPGVTVLEKGTTNGTVTTADGNYTLTTTQSNSTLIFSFIGYSTKEIPVSNRSSINVSMGLANTQIDEVVVVGYGEQKRANVLGAVESLEPAKVQDYPAANMATLLEGRLPGVHVGQSSGRPGANTSLSIRETSSWNNTPVLYVIDGFIRDDGGVAFNNLDPSEIESISVLKDASAAVYGARAAGGVVLVKTKRGQEGKIKINYSGSQGFSNATHIPEMLSAYEHASLLNAALKVTNPTNYESQSGWYTEDELEHFKNTNYNWLDEAWQSSSISRHTLNVSGGSDKVRYFGGGSYYKETGNLPGTNLNRYSLRLGLDANVTKDLSASLQLSSSNREEERPFNRLDSNPDPMNGTFDALLRAPRWLPPYINGLPVGQSGTVASHPLEVDKINSYARSKGSNIVLNAALEYKIPVVEGLKVRAAYSRSEGNSHSKQMRVNYYLYNFATTGGNNHIITDQVVGNPTRINNNERLQEAFDYGKSYQLNGSISYDRNFGLHDVSGLLLYEQSESESNGFTALREDMVIENYERQEAFSEAKDGTSSSAGNNARLSYVGRVNYSYASKYLFESSFRYEGSVYFPPETRWGFFPSVAVGWRVSEESFFKDNVTFMDNLKFRVSAGLLGSDAVGAARDWVLSYGTTGGAYLGGTDLTNALNPRNSGVVSTGVTWEKTASYNAGLDMRFFNNLSVTFDGYFRRTYDILDSRSNALPTTTGVDKMPKENFGEMHAWGYDGSVRYDGKITNDLLFDVGVNVSWSRSKVIEKFQSEGAIGTWKDEIGKMPGHEVGYISTGIIRTQEELNAILEANPNYTIFGRKPELGMLNYQDTYGPRFSAPDGKIDGWDETEIAPAVSALGFSFNLGARWKGLRVSTVVGLGGFGTKVFYDKEAITPPSSKLNAIALWKDYWSPDNVDASFPRPVNYGGDGQRSTFWMEDGLSMSLSQLNASYDLPSSISEKLHIPHLRVYFSGRNLWRIINPYDYKDPSISRYNSYPMMRTFNFGVNVSI